MFLDMRNQLLQLGVLINNFVEKKLKKYCANDKKPQGGSGRSNNQADYLNIHRVSQFWVLLQIISHQRISEIYPINQTESCTEKLLRAGCVSVCDTRNVP